MFRLLDRYIGRELLTSALFAVATLSLVLVLGQIFKKLFEFVVDHNVPATFIITFVAYFLPLSLTLSIPWGFLTAVLLVFGRLSAGNELTAPAHGGHRHPAHRPAGFGIGVRVLRRVFVDQSLRRAARAAKPQGRVLPDRDEQPRGGFHRGSSHQ